MYLQKSFFDQFHKNIKLPPFEHPGQYRIHLSILAGRSQKAPGNTDVRAIDHFTMKPPGLKKEMHTFEVYASIRNLFSLRGLHKNDFPLRAPG